MCYQAGEGELFPDPQPSRYPAGEGSLHQTNLSALWRSCCHQPCRKLNIHKLLLQALDATRHSKTLNLTGINAYFQIKVGFAHCQ